MRSIDAIKGKWRQHIGAAKVAWGELTEDELLKAEGRHLPVIASMLRMETHLNS